MSNIVKVIYNLKDGSSLLYQNPSNILLGRVKDGSCIYKTGYYDAKFMLLILEEDTNKGDLIFVDGVNGLKSKVTNQFGIATRNAPKGSALHICLKGIVDLNGSYGQEGDNVYLNEETTPFTLTNESQNNQVLGANFLEEGIARFYDI